MINFTAIYSSLFGDNMGSKVKGIVTPKDHVPNRKPNNPRYGIGETVELKITIMPNYSYDRIWWKKKGDKGNLEQLQDSNGKASYTFGHTKGNEILELWGESNNIKELLDKITFEVIEPDNNTRLIKIMNIEHEQGLASAGFIGAFLFLPKDVSFTAIEFKEGTETYGASGSGEALAHIQNYPHKESPRWIPGHSVTKHGTTLQGCDTVSWSAIQIPKGGWIPSDSETTKGELNRTIKWFYRIKGDNKTKKCFQNPTSKVIVYADGSVYRGKGDTYRKAALHDPTDPEIPDLNILFSMIMKKLNDDIEPT